MSTGLGLSKRDNRRQVRRTEEVGEDTSLWDRNMCRAFNSLTPELEQVLESTPRDKVLSKPPYHLNRSGPFLWEANGLNRGGEILVTLFLDERALIAARHFGRRYHSWPQDGTVGRRGKTPHTTSRRAVSS